MLFCRYRTDVATGKLVYHNECEEYVNKMYRLKCLVISRNILNNRLWKLITDLECRLFQYNGELFKAWMFDNKEWIKTDIRVVERQFYEEGCSDLTSKEKEEILNILKEFVV